MNNRGFSLVSTLVAFGLLSILMIGTAQLTALAAKTTRSQVTATQLLVFRDRLRGMLGTESGCTLALSGQATGDALVVRDPWTNAIIASEGFLDPVGGFTVSRLRLINAADAPGGVGLRKATLQLVVTRDMTRQIGAPELRREVGDLFYTESGGKVTTCYGPLPPPTLDSTVAAVMCGAFGGDWQTGGGCFLPPGQVNNNGKGK